MEARIMRSAQRVFDCELVESKREIQAKAHGKLLKGADLVVGDFVIIEESSVTGEYEIISRNQRNSEIFRFISRERKKKTIAANIDYMAIVCSYENPVFKRGLIDRYLLRANQWNCLPIVIFNKFDIAFEKSIKQIEFEKDVLESLEVPYFILSAIDTENHSDDFKRLKEKILNKSLIFLGQSGVGKSSLISSLTDGRVDLKTKAIGKIGKGTHTTTWSEIIDCENFSLVDSPGIRSFSLNDLLAEEVEELFEDLTPLFLQCKFNNCKHEHTSSGCAVYNHESPVVQARFESYKRFMAEVSEEAGWLKKKNRG